MSGKHTSSHEDEEPLSDAQMVPGKYAVCNIDRKRDPNIPMNIWTALCESTTNGIGSSNWFRNIKKYSEVPRKDE